MLALTTTQSFCILDENSGNLWQIDSGKGVYYGITFDKERIYVAARQAEYGGGRDGHKNVILCYDSTLKFMSILKPPLPIRDVHQITVESDILYVCSTYDDLIGCCHIPTGEWHIWQPFEPYEAPGKDLHHINSIVVDGNEILLAGNKPRGWAARFDKVSGKLKGTVLWIGNQTHNVWTENDLLHVCSSGDSAILNEREESHPLVPGSWVRGYCSGEGRHFVGLSEALTRHDRAFSNCCVVEYDSQFQFVRSFWMPGTGMAHDLRMLDKPDHSHNRLTFPLDTKVLDKRFFRWTLADTLGSFEQRECA